MASRIRIIVEGLDHCRYTGGRAMLLLRQITRIPLREISWAEVERIGQNRKFWRRLYVWRERRGISNCFSAYFKGLGRGFTPSPPVARQLAISLARRSRKRSLSV